MRRGFSLIELIFVIVVGILAKFGTNLMMTVYKAYTASTINNRLQADAELTLKQIANRLQYRIKDSVIARTAPNAAPFRAIDSAAAGDVVLEWIGYDIDGWLGTNRAGANGEPAFNRPTWSGFIDISDAGAIASNQGAAAVPYLESPETDMNLSRATMTAMVANGQGTPFPAIFFTGANSDVQTDYGWNGAQNHQVSAAAHPVVGSALQPTRLYDATTLVAAPPAWPSSQAALPIGNPSSFRNTDIYENYKLAWTAYAISLEDGDNDGNVDDLVLYYSYQPWRGIATPAANDPDRRQLLLQNVDTFKFSAVGDTIKVQICVNEENTLGEGEYAICKETAIF